MKKSITEYGNHQTYYKFECDDINKPEKLHTDISYSLTETLVLDTLIKRCDELKLKYSVYYEVFNRDTQEIIIKEMIHDTNL
tara:strand:+ start:415 stop:660 length:246 start_codon:yes stop_codon:yes gene_type:complete